MNKIILMGRLTRDPDIRYSQGENSMAIARFTLAVNRRYKSDAGSDEQTADFIQCVAFSKSAEFIEKYCVQGTKLVTEGRWNTGSYTNKEGIKVYTNDCIIEHCEFAENKSSSNQEQSENTSSRPEPSSASTGFMNIPEGIDIDNDGFMNINPDDPDDLPFV